MEVRPGANPNDVKNYDTDRLRHDFLIQDVFVPGEIKTIYSQIDRIIVGSATPTDKALKLTAGDELRAAYFLERREMGDRKSTRLNSSHYQQSRMPSSA